MTMTPNQTRSLLVELQTEELPPKALNNMGKAFAEGLLNTLREHHLVEADATVTAYATPRRLAALISHVKGQADDQPFAEKLMPVKIGLDADGNLTPALSKRLDSKGLGHLTANDLHVESDGKQDYLFAKGMAKGASLAEGLQAALDYSITHLPIPKVMRYQLADGLTSVRFVRPAHSLIALWGDEVVQVSTLGLNAGRTTKGHRFMCESQITINSPESYVGQLEQEGKVVASYDERRARIEAQLQAACTRLNASLGTDPEVVELLDEVTALVEHPSVYVGQFDPIFLEVPPECLILTMRLNQRYFPLFDPKQGTLTNRFLIVSNMELADPSNIVSGNEKVILPRLADARFFFETDRKQPLEARVSSLENSVYHNKLGSQRQRVERMRTIIKALAERLGANPQLADRAALLAKADLNTNMVGEFPELQGVMGAYYAAADGEDTTVIDALRNQYQHRLSQPVTDASLVSALLFLTERAETLMGIWGIGLAPTGERDPYALRRAALGLISAFEQLEAGGYLGDIAHSRLDVAQLLAIAAQSFEAGELADNTLAEVQAFIYERYRNQLVASGLDRNVVEAVLAQQPPLQQVHARIQACSDFAALPEAQSLASANKRIGNLLRKADSELNAVNTALFTEAAETALATCIEQLAPVAERQFMAGEFGASLATLAQAKEPVDNFFADVMVMAEDPAVRNNRLALLQKLHQLMNQVADISRLAA